MRIVQALGWYFPDRLGGTEVYVGGLARQLRAIGHDVVIAAPDPGHTAVRRYEHEGVPVFRYPIPSTPTREECQGRVPVRGTDRFHEWLFTNRPDVVHFHTLLTGLGLSELRAAKATGARTIVTSHTSSLGYVCQRGTMMHWGETLCDGVCLPPKCAACELQRRGLPKPLASLIGATPRTWSETASNLPGKIGTAIALRGQIAYNQARQRGVYGVVDNFVVLTKWAMEALVANGAPAEKLVLNRLGMSHQNFVRKPLPAVKPTKPPVKIGYLGRFDPLKGVYDLARALKALPIDMLFEAEFRGPVNSGEDQHVIDQLVRILDGDKRVTIASSVDSGGVSDALKSYDVLCCPSVCVEGGPTVAIEAHAVGTPVIGTRIGGLSELVVDGVTGQLVPPGDWRALATLLSRIVTQPDKTIDRWRTALPTARTMDAIATDYLALYIA
jgi:glycosyltransferase involved in cell wall biosynthesis